MPLDIKRSRFQDPSWMLKNAGQCIANIAPWTVAICEEPVISDTECEVLCTYSWSLRGSKQYNPIIYVPGLPPKWAPMALPVQLPADKDESMVDAHAYWAPVFQFEPTFQAIAIMNPNMRFDDIDIVINRNSISKLLDFVSWDFRDRPFHLDLHLIGNTLIIGRKEKWATIRGDGKVWGRSFENSFTSAQDNTADTYHRVIRYKLGDLNIAVRHEVDCYDESAPPTMQKFERFQGIDKPDDPNSTIRLPILHSKGIAVFERGTPLHKCLLLGIFLLTRDTCCLSWLFERSLTLPGGIRIPQHQIAELKAADWKGKATPQCWFRRTANLCVAVHKKEEFTKAEMKDVWAQCVAWEEKEQYNLRRLAGFLRQIREIIQRTKSRRGVLVKVEKEAPIQIYEGKEGMGDALPPEVRTRFWSH